MSEQDEGLRAVLAAHRFIVTTSVDGSKDYGWCGCGGSYATKHISEHEAHLADAITAHLGATLASEPTWEVVAEKIGDVRDEHPRTSDDADSGEIADAVLAVVADALGVKP